jgi:hypothetical protein
MWQLAVHKISNVHMRIQRWIKEDVKKEIVMISLLNDLLKLIYTPFCKLLKKGIHNVAIVGKIFYANLKWA